MPMVMEQIDKMNVDEKVEVMNYIWTTLEASDSSYEPPPWHLAELARRDKLYAEGKIPVYDWSEVKARLASRQAAL